MTLYRTHRPRQFSELVGQDSVTHTLQQALRQERLAQAYLFTGPRGTGKTSTARIFAKTICCLTPVMKEAGETVSFEACGKCASCLLLDEGRTPDFIELDAASNRGIEDIREIREQAQYPPLQLSRKIYLIDEVHMLTVEAFNALLKTLEEPPAQCLFILATTEPHKVPLTIRSRCQLVRFERGSQEDIARKLDRIVTKENLDVATGVTQLIARHADGGYRDAETMLESLTTRHRPLGLDQALASLGVMPEETLESLVNAVLSQDKTATLTLLRERIAGGSEPVDRILSQSLSSLQARLLDPNRPEPGSLLAYAMQQFLEAFLLQKSSPDPLICLEIACLNVCDFGTNVTPVDRQGIFSQEEKKATREVNSALATPVRTAVAQPIVAVPTPPVPTVPVVELREAADGPLPDMRRIWKEMAEEVCRENIVLGQFLKDTVFHTVEGNVITVRVRFKFHADKMDEKKSRGFILSTLTKLTGRDWQVIYEISGLAPRRPAGKSLTDGTSDVAAVFGSPTP